MDLKATIRFNNVTASEKRRILTFSDASFNISSKQVYGQTGVIKGIAVNNEHGFPNFYPIDWASAKQRRVTHSSYGAEILACAEGDDRGYNLKSILESVGKEWCMDHEMVVDSKSLYDTISKLHEGKDYRLRQTVQSIRDSFEAHNLNKLS